MTYKLLRSIPATKASNGKLQTVAVYEGTNELVIETWDADDRRAVAERVELPAPRTTEDLRIRMALRKEAARRAREIAAGAASAWSF